MFIDSILEGFPAMFEASGEAFSSLANWRPILALIVGVVVGVLNGAMPGGAVPSLIVLLGFAYGLDPYIALPLAVGMVATVPTGDTLPAVLLGMPGSTSGQATILDGNPLARQGRAGVALSAAYFASLLGGIIGAVFLFVTIPVARPVVNTFSAAEFFVLGLVAIAVVGVVSSGALLRGLIAGAFGLLIASVGYDDATGAHRLTFGQDYLWDGIHIIPVVIGLFAIPEFFDMVVSDVSIARRAQTAQFDASAQRREGMAAVLRNWLLVIRSAAMGVFVGLLPGIGGSLAQWLSYASARQTVRGGTETFGTGDIRGVIAPESANNAVDGGQLVPTLFFNVPGSVGMALFIGLLIVLDVRPGPDMLNSQLPLTMTIAFSLVMANVFATGLALGFTPVLTRIAFVRPNILVPIILAVMTIAAFQANRSIYDLVVMLAFGALGYFMKSYGWPRPPIIIAVILGGIIERYYGIASGAFDWVNFSNPTEGVFTRPAVIIIILIAVGTAAYTVRMQRSVNRTMQRQEAEFAARAETAPSPPAGASEDAPEPPRAETATSRSRPPLLSLLRPTPSGIFIALLTFAFAFTFWQTFEWTSQAARLPRVITVVGLALVGAYAVSHLVSPPSGAGRIMDIGRTRTDDDRRVLMLRTVKAIGTTFGLVLAIWLIGFQIALPAYVFLYLFFFGHVRWWAALGWLIVFVALIYGFFDEVIHIPWIDPVLGDFIPDILKGRETITQFWGRLSG
ncbi:MAG: tripartite tricarboxylate transporter permease [Chloroflexota bacterium]|nr:tripartite tricarboxylate transporter permease [Chloroflexota bacterium]MDE2885235.1 tripartite tricarboxylate transporter permease [Chloroflexota bacterium]